MLLTVGALGDDAYGVTIQEMLKEKTRKNPSIGALHSALYRLEEKGFLSSHEGGATAERGGRRKKYYQITASGIRILEEANELRMKFAKEIKGLNFGID